MPPSELQTTQLLPLLQGLRQGDRAAADELLRLAGRRLEVLARQMLRAFPLVRAREQTDDVLQEVVLSFLGALRQLDVHSTRAFYALANEHLRRRLLDLARRHRRTPGSLPGLESLPDRADEDDLERWQDLHEAVGQLPAELQAVFEQRFYHGWTWPELAALLEISERTARRRWLAAGVILARQLGGKLPEADPLESP
jgi:RNA polymerase sigma-70 factor (ECF subfamily)